MATTKLEGQGTIVGKTSPDFTLFDQDGQPFNLDKTCKKGPILLAFYPGDFTAVCTKQLCNYQDNLSSFQGLGLQLVGISKNSTEEHAKFAKQYQFQFKLLTDPKNQIAKLLGCSSSWMLGMVSRAVLILNSNRMILYKYIEPTAVTRRSAEELLKIVNDLKSHGMV